MLILFIFTVSCEDTPQKTAEYHPQLPAPETQQGGQAQQPAVKKDLNRQDRFNNNISVMEYESVEDHVGYAIQVPPPASLKPNNWNTEDYDLIVENAFQSPLTEQLSTFSVDVDRAAYSNIRSYITSNQMPPKDAVRIEEMINYFEYNYEQPSDEHPFNIVTEVANCPWQKDHQLLLVGLQGKKIPTENLPPSNLVFLIDVSGSMNDYNKLPLLQQSYKLLVDQMRPEDRVSIVVYAGSSGAVLPPTSGEEKIKIKNAINQLQAGGSTAGGEGIELAYKLAEENFIKNGNNRVILATDGDFNIGVSSDGALTRLIEEKRESGVFLTVMGFGHGNYMDNKMQKLANAGNGNHMYIDNIKEAQKVLVHEFGGTNFTIAKDVKIQIEFNPSEVQGYRLIGYENRMLESQAFNNDKKDAGEIGSGHAVTAIYEIIPEGVESQFLPSIDPLKYSSNKPTDKANKELATIKFRYKQPNGSKSILMTEVIDNKVKDFKQSSENLKWACSVTQFGLLLRDSEFKGNSNFNSLYETSRSLVNKNNDQEGFKSEFVDLVKHVASLN